MQLQFPISGIDVVGRQFAAMHRMTIDDQDDALLGSEHELLQELHEHLAVDTTVHEHELHSAVPADGRNHVDRGAPPHGLDDGSLAARRPGGAGVVVAAHAGFVSEHNHCALSLGPGAQGRQIVVEPLLHEHCVLLISAMQRALRSEAQLVHDLARGRQAQRHAEAPLDQLTNEAQGPQAEAEAQLIGRVVAHRDGDPLHLFGCDFQWPAAAEFGSKPILALVGKCSQPAEYRARGDVKELGNLTDRGAGLDHFHGLHSNPLLFMTATGEYWLGRKVCFIPNQNSTAESGLCEVFSFIS